MFQVLEENNALEERTYSPLEGHTYAINHVEFSKNGNMLASCSLDGCTIIWNTTVVKLKDDMKICYNIIFFLDRAEGNVSTEEYPFR